MILQSFKFFIMQADKKTIPAIELISAGKAALSLPL